MKGEVVLDEVVMLEGEGEAGAGAGAGLSEGPTSTVVPGASTVTPDSGSTWTSVPGAVTKTPEGPTSTEPPGN